MNFLIISDNTTYWKNDDGHRRIDSDSLIVKDKVTERTNDLEVQAVSQS